MPNLRHAFVSPKSDGSDATVVRPSNWNDRIEYADFAGTSPSGVNAFVREVILGDLSLYVRTDGSDSNDGTVDSSGGAFLTLQAALNRVASAYDTAGFNVVISLGSGTFDGGTVVPWVGGGTLYISGNGSTNTTISSTSNCVYVNQAIPGIVNVRNIKLTSSSAGCMIMSAPGVMRIGVDVEFGTAGFRHVSTDVPGAQIYFASSYKISGGAPYHMLVQASSQIECDGAPTVTLTGTPAFANQFVFVTYSALFYAAGPITYSGAATGQRYQATYNSVINTQGGGANYFPGDAAGSVGTGGIYA